MNVVVNIGGKSYEVDLEHAIDLSIPLRFNGPQPNAYGADRAVSQAVEAGSLVGDTRRGGSCNFEQYTFIPHCNGTHTESIGHITNERISVRNSLRDVFIPAMLISVEPELASTTSESYGSSKDENDRLITSAVLKQAIDWQPANAGSSDSLIVRTLRNDDSKLTREYLNEMPPYFSHEAMQFIVEMGVKHLLVDLPSIDRMFDEGKLSNHRIFWNVEEGSFDTKPDSRINNTVTEFIYVPNTVEDGRYLLNLQIAPFVSDAAPCRPVIFKLR